MLYDVDFAAATFEEPKIELMERSQTAVYIYIYIYIDIYRYMHYIITECIILHGIVYMHMHNMH